MTLPVLLEERFDAIRFSQAPSGAVSPRARSGRDALVLIGACLALASLSLLLPSAPTYDPWSWIIWGREITHLDLVTSQGPSWKPLPVMFTTIFSLFGSIAPDLWLVVARAGAIAGVVLAFRVARRLGGGVPGGLAAAAGLAVAPWWIRNGAMGNSEGLIVAFLLAAIDRHLAGDRRAAFFAAVCAGLLRPEAWPFLGLYGAALLWMRAVPARVVVTAGIAVLALWLLPEWWGSGDLLRAAHRAQDVNPGAPTYADNPAIEVLRNAGRMLTVPMLLGLVGALASLISRRDRRLAVLAAMAAAWLGVVAYMTQDGFSGNQRYLIAPVALLIVLAGAGAGWALTAAGRRVLSGRPAAEMAVLAVLGVAAFAVPSVRHLAPTMRSLHYQADLADELPALIRQAGGAAALKRCGDPFTGPFLVPVVAWTLGLHTRQVGLHPSQPAVVFRVRTTRHSPPSPTLRDVGDLASVAIGAHWRIVESCRRAGTGLRQ